MTTLKEATEGGEQFTISDDATPLWLWEIYGKVWYLVPSWKVAIKKQPGIDWRVNRRLDRQDCWVLTEATTGMQAAVTFPDGMGLSPSAPDVVEKFLEERPDITVEQIHAAMARGAAALAELPPNPVDTALALANCK